MTLFGQHPTSSTKKDSQSNSQSQSQFMIKLKEFFLPLTMNFSSQTNSRHHFTLSVLLKETKLNIYSDWLLNNSWLIHQCSSTRAQKAWTCSSTRMPQVPPKWLFSRKKKPSMIMDWPRTVDSFSNTDVVEPQDGE